MNKDFSEVLNYYNPTFFQKIWWPIRRLIYNFPWHCKQVKFFIQRGKRGWADCDWWGMDYYLIGIILPMLKELKEHCHGYPGYGKVSTPEKWDSTLDEMILGFEAGKRICENEYFDIFQPNWFEKNEKLTSDTLKKCQEETLKDQKLFHEKIKLFNKYFFSLWD